MNSKGIRYFTLEKSSYNGSEGWMLGENTADGAHHNFGRVDDCRSPKEFVELLNGGGLVDESGADDGSKSEYKKSVFKRFSEKIRNILKL